MTGATLARGDTYARVMQQWFVDAQRQPVNLATIRGGDGNAIADVWRLVEDDNGTVLRYRWARAGRPLSSFEVERALLTASGGPVPPEHAPTVSPTLAPATPTYPRFLDYTDSVLYSVDLAADAVAPLADPTGRLVTSIEVDGAVNRLVTSGAGPLAAHFYAIDGYWFPPGPAAVLGGGAQSEVAAASRLVIAVDGAFVAEVDGPTVTDGDAGWQDFVSGAHNIVANMRVGFVSAAALAAPVNFVLSARTSWST